MSIIAGNNYINKIDIDNKIIEASNKIKFAKKKLQKKIWLF